MEMKTNKIKFTIMAIVLGFSVMLTSLGTSMASTAKEETVSQTAGTAVEARALSATNLDETQAATLETKPVSPFMGKFITNISDYVNVRAEASADAQLLGKLYAGSGGVVLERGDEWSKISSGNLTGYVLNEFIAVDEAAEALANQICPWIATVNTETMKVRKEPGTDSGVWGLASSAETFTVTQILDGWVAVDYNGNTGYLSTEFITLAQKIGTGVTVEEEAAAAQAEQERLAAIEAEKQRQEAAKQAKIQQAIAASSLPMTVQTSAYGVTENDAYLLACVVACEAGSEPYDGKLAVANVVLNRLNSGRYGSTISSVVYASGQFSIVASGALDRKLQSGPNSESLRAAQDALSGVNNVPGFTSFCATSVANYGSYSDYAVIGNQVFYHR
ncbi:cell wall hydrolase [Parasporobacterium paucivorans]|uniref:SH3 domain-containing protein n=1 Tax=Parasporobacterium paucivorans DSM 15970 TaxID=1122934 RepID=A0A1M6JRB7_9FIRM|nr:cell wall hydrolase [Parasporobacterium paucivorans]SHJ49163.1 SH3 domain-containing protein [Parasporobacterium paucivorans DSM 15970]